MSTPGPSREQQGARVEVPTWLQPMAELAATIDAERLAPRFPHPPADARPSAVLLCFAEGPAGPEIVLTERTSHLRNHAGQISFPGGSRDPGDVDAAHTALREAHEEVGLVPSEVAVFGDLPTLWLPPSNFAVTPVLGWWADRRTLHPTSPTEVERVLQPTIDSLLDPTKRYSVVHPSGWQGPAFDLMSEVPLWGFTAGVLSRLFDALGWTKDWDESVVRPLPGMP